MKTYQIITLGTTVLLLAAGTLAHDPSSHGNADEGPDCKNMEAMDHSKMQMDDPVMVAMMKKCSEHMRHQNSTGSKIMTHTSHENHNEMKGESNDDQEMPKISHDHNH